MRTGGGRSTSRPTAKGAGYKIVGRDAKSEAGQDRAVYVDTDACAISRSGRKSQAEERLKWGADNRDGGCVHVKNGFRTARTTSPRPPRACCGGPASPPPSC